MPTLRITDAEYDYFVDIFRNSSQILYNGAIFVEIERLLMDELLWGVPLKQVALQRAFKKWTNILQIIYIIFIRFSY